MKINSTKRRRPNSTILHGNASYNTNFAKFDNTKILNNSCGKQKFWSVAAFIFAVLVTISCAVFVDIISPGFFILIVLFVWIVFAFSVYCVFNEKKINKRVNSINGFLENQVPGSYSMSYIQKKCNISLDRKEKEQVFNVINKMPQYDASVSINAIVKRL